MEIREIKVDVRVKESVQPTLKFDFEVEGKVEVKYSPPLSETYPTVEFLNGIIFSQNYDVISHIFPYLSRSQNSHLKVQLYSQTPRLTQSQDIIEKLHGISYLDYNIVRYMDELRRADSKKDLHLILGLEFRLFYLTIEGKGVARGLISNMDKVYRYIPLRITASDWVHDFAPKLGLGKYLIVEIPIGDKILEEAYEYLMRAEQAFRNWDDKGVFGYCREAVKLIKNHIGKTVSAEEKRKWGKIRGDINKLFVTLENLSSVGLHEGDIGPVRRYDTELVLYLTKLLLHYAGQVLRDIRQ